MHKHLMSKIIANGKQEDMEHLGEMFDNMLVELKSLDYDMYKKIEYKMYKMVYGEHLNDELARKWVSCMDNKDGTKGEHWTYEQTSQFAGNHDKWDWYATLNMMYSDYYSQHFDTNVYVELANDWLADTDVGAGKTLRYYWFVVKD